MRLDVPLTVPASGCIAALVGTWPIRNLYNCFLEFYYVLTKMPASIIMDCFLIIKKNYYRYYQQLILADRE
jgi:hypothetical protein